MKRQKEQVVLTVEVSFKADVDPKEISERSERFDNLLFDEVLSCLRPTPPPAKKERPGENYAILHA